jgi:hypothetical protein
MKHKTKKETKTTTQQKHTKKTPPTHPTHNHPITPPKKIDNHKTKN